MFCGLQMHFTLQAFGAPFIVAHVNGEKEVFFGSDRMELLAYVLGNSNMHAVHTLVTLSFPNTAHGTGEKWEGPLVESVRSRL